MIAPGNQHRLAPPSKNLGENALLGRASASFREVADLRHDLREEEHGGANTKEQGATY